MTDLLSPSEPNPTDANTVPPSRQLCAVCNQCYSIYTCPRCATRTCSLPCSSSHKSNTGCTGERDGAAYVSMHQYGWGTMMNDYVFLEDVGRRVGDWGKEIAKGGYSMKESNGPGTRGNFRGRGRRRAGASTKRDILKLQLEARDIDMELLPLGMERRKLNQSHWETKNQTALMTMEFKFHPPRDRLAPSTQQPDPPFVVLTHKNNMNTPLLSLIQHAVERKKDHPEWVKYLVVPHPDDPDSFRAPDCVMTAQVDPRAVILPNARKRAACYRFDPSKSLAVLLRHTHFVEFPAIEIWEEFTGTVVDAAGTVTQQPEVEERQPKRRKIVTKAGRKAMNLLLGGYGSDREEEKQPAGGLSLLGDYTASDEEGFDQKREIEEETIGELDSEGEDEVEIDPTVLLELVRQAHGKERWEVSFGEDDEVDWGEEEEDR